MILSTEYTVFGSKTRLRETNDQTGVSIIIYNTEAKSYRKTIFSKLSQLPVDEIISLEFAPCPEDVYNLSKSFPNIRFMIFPTQTSIGECIDIAVSEIKGTHFLVLSGHLDFDLEDKLESYLEKISDQNQLCVVPVISNRYDEILPTLFYPTIELKDQFEAQPIIPEYKNTNTLFPFHYCGIYNKSKHINIGGFDNRIHQEWWQLIEFGSRAWLWGEKIYADSIFRLSLIEEDYPYNTSVSSDYRFFYLKILAVLFKDNNAIIPAVSWYNFLQYTKKNIFYSRKEWKQIRNWFNENKSRYQTDMLDLIEHWEG